MHSYTIYIARKKNVYEREYSLSSVTEDEKDLPEHCQRDNAGQNRNPSHLGRSSAHEMQTCRIFERAFLIYGFKNII